MSTEVATLPDFTPEQLSLITNTIARGATKDELRLFLYRCKILGLDPLKPGQIYFIKYGNNPGAMVVGIDGFRSKAAKTGQVCGVERGVTRDEKGKVTEGWAKVYRKDWQLPAHEIAPLAEYNTGKGNWAKMPETMIKKVAEAAALRMAFPDDLGGVYIEEEMEQADRGGVYPEQPGPDDGVQTDEYCCSGNLAKAFPALTRKPISKCDPSILRSAIELIESKAKNSGKSIPSWAAEFIMHAEPIVSDWENAQPQNPDALTLDDEPGAEG